MKKTLFGAVAAAGIVAATFASGPAAAGQKFISIGTGGITGVYYPTGGAICRLMNKRKKETGIRCSVESTGGSIYNINNVRSGELDFGVAQSDWQYHAYHGTSKFKDKGPFKGLRAVFSIHAEPVTIIARDDSGIKNILDLKGKRFNIGNPGSGTRGTWEVIEQTLGWKRSDLKLATELKSAETGQAMCDNKIDAFFWLVGHPSAGTEEALASCPSHLVDATAPKINEMVAKTPFYAPAEIPAGMYPGQKDAVKTWGVRATLVTSDKVPDDVVYNLVKSVFDNFDSFKKLHKAFGHLKAESMIKDGLSAPLHPGAVKYYKERGWIK